jgi:hypothetical protein
VTFRPKSNRLAGQLARLSGQRIDLEIRQFPPTADCGGRRQFVNRVPDMCGPGLGPGAGSAKYFVKLDGGGTLGTRRPGGGSSFHLSWPVAVRICQ